MPGLREAVEINRGRAFTSINRRDGRRVVQVTADINDRSRSGEIENALRNTEMPRLLEASDFENLSKMSRRCDGRFYDLSPAR